jgi:hypothetical protein
MATHTQIFGPALARVDFIKKRDDFIEKIIPRRCMVGSVGLIFAGMSIPLLMQVGFLQVCFLLGFVGFALVATGGVMALIYYGEI